MDVNSEAGSRVSWAAVYPCQRIRYCWTPLRFRAPTTFSTLKLSGSTGRETGRFLADVWPHIPITDRMCRTLYIRGVSLKLDKLKACTIPFITLRLPMIGSSMAPPLFFVRHTGTSDYARTHELLQRIEEENRDDFLFEYDASLYRQYPVSVCWHQDQGHQELSVRSKQNLNFKILLKCDWSLIYSMTR